MIHAQLMNYLIVLLHVKFMALLYEELLTDEHYNQWIYMCKIFFCETVTYINKVIMEMVCN